MLTRKQVTQLMLRCHRQYHYKQDTQLGYPMDYWITLPDTLDDTEVFTGDCDVFIGLVRRELAKRREPCRVATVGYKSNRVNQAMVLYGPWALDHRHSRPMDRDHLTDYKFFTISGYTEGEAWSTLL